MRSRPVFLAATIAPILLFCNGLRAQITVEDDLARTVTLGKPATKIALRSATTS